jgi:hypothetical protein
MEDKAKPTVDNTTHKTNTSTDDLNKKAISVMKNEGIEAAVKHMFTDYVTGRTLTYSEMRHRYG